MEISIHEVKRVETKLKLFNEFSILEITATDKEGREVKLSLFANDLENLTLHQKPVRVAYDR